MHSTLLLAQRHNINIARTLDDKRSNSQALKWRLVHGDQPHSSSVSRNAVLSEKRETMWPSSPMLNNRTSMASGRRVAYRSAAASTTVLVGLDAIYLHTSQFSARKKSTLPSHNCFRGDQVTRSAHHQNKTRPRFNSQGA